MLTGVAVLGGLGLVFFLPGWVNLADDDASAAVVDTADSAWESPTPAKPIHSELGGTDVYAAFTPESGSVENTPEIDDSWFSGDGGGMPADDDGLEELACIIEPFHSVEIGSPVTGLIKKIHVEWSDFVQAGQVLVELESEAEWAAVQLARAQAEMTEGIESREATAALIERRRKRLARLYEQNTLSLDLREEVETQAQVARIALEQAHTDQRLASLQLDQAVALLKRRTIRAPFSGVVVERLMSPGERVEEEAILRIAQIDPLRVEVILPSSAFGRIQVGMRAAVVPEFPGDTVHVAPVTVVDRVVDAASGTFGVRLELPNPKRDIPVGLHCQVRFLAD
jgi:RND family efflux transporter MFP subunit